MTQHNAARTLSGVGVLDKSVVLLDALAESAATLADLVTRTGIPRPTTYRLAVALETHRLVARDPAGRFTLGPRLAELGRGAGNVLASAAVPVLGELRDRTNESAQLYQRDGAVRRCVAAADRRTGLRDSVPVGAELPMTAGSAAHVLLAWEPGDESSRAKAAFPANALTAVRRRGWASSVAERESGVASVSAPVFDREGHVVAAVSVSGPIDRLTRQPGRLHADAVMAAAKTLSAIAGAVS